MYIWIIGRACLCESSPLNSQSCILDPISWHEHPTWPYTFLPPRSRTWLIFVFLTVGRRAFVQSDYLTIRAALISLASHSLTTLPPGGRVAEEARVKALHDGQFWLLFSPFTPISRLYLHLSHPSHSFPLLLPPPFLIVPGAELQSVPLLARSPSTNRKYPPLSIDKLEEEINRRMADDNKLFREEFNVWHTRTHSDIYWFRHVSLSHNMASFYKPLH